MDSPFVTTISHLSSVQDPLSGLELSQAAESSSRRIQDRGNIPQIILIGRLENPKCCFQDLQNADSATNVRILIE